MNLRSGNARLVWRGGRAVDCAGLENRKAERSREFESHPLRSHRRASKRGDCNNTLHNKFVHFSGVQYYLLTSVLGTRETKAGHESNPLMSRGIACRARSRT